MMLCWIPTANQEILPKPKQTNITNPFKETPHKQPPLPTTITKRNYLRLIYKNKSNYPRKIQI